MSTTEKRILAALVDITLRGAATLGIERSQLLAVAELDEQDIADRDAYVPLRHQLALHGEMARRIPDTDVGLAILEFARISTLGVLGYALGHSATLGDALDAFVRYSRLLGDFERWSTSHGRRDGHAWLQVDMAPEIDARSDELGLPALVPLGCWLRIGHRLTGVAFHAEAVSFRGVWRAPRAAIENLFGCPVHLGAEHNRLELSREVMALPVVGARPALRSSFIPVLQARLDAVRGTERFADKVHARLLEKLPTGVASKDELARELGMGGRTLARRLREEGTSFRDVLDRARQELAEMWLDNPDNAIYEVAYLLGYSEPSAFHRTFRRWTGLTPRAWRAQRFAAVTDAGYSQTLS